MSSFQTARIIREVLLPLVRERETASRQLTLEAILSDHPRHVPSRCTRRSLSLDEFIAGMPAPDA
jgi:hypothetical protein